MSEVFTKLGKIQANFNTFRLRDVLTISDSGVWGDELEPNTDGTKIIRSTNFTNTGELDLSDVAVRKIAKDKALEKKLLNGDILIERSGGSDTQPVGRVAFSDFEIEKSNYAFANFIQRIRFNNEVDPRFVFYCLLQMHQMGATESIQNQTTGIRNLDLKSYLRVDLPKPEKNEQVRISSLLSQVDNVIQKTKDSITQAQQLKRALMQHLLSGRLKSDGTWRKPDEFYMDERIGRVPKGWKVKTSNDVFFINRETLSAKTPDDYEFNYITIEVVTTEEIQWDAVTKCVFKDAPSRARRVISSGDILLSTVRPNLKSFAIFNAPNEEKWICSTGFSVFTPKPNQDRDFYFYQILGEIGEKQFYSYVAGTNYPAVNDRDMRKLRLLEAPYPEQKEISKKLTQISQSISMKSNKIKVLRTLQKSLMQNLLTGKIRVQAE